MEWYERFYAKEKWVKKSAEIEGKSYDKLKEIAEKELDASVDDLKLEDKVIIYRKEKNEISVARSIIIRDSSYKKLEDLREEYGISVSKIINIAIKLGLEKYEKREIKEEH